MTTRVDKEAQDYQGCYVYPNDAEDIKAHPFFHGLSWGRLHLSRPPFVPDVKSCDDTKYFDNEDEISDVEDESSYSIANETTDLNAEECNMAAARPTQVAIVDGAKRRLRNVQNLEEQVMEAVDGRERMSAKVKEKKRPRDRVLRDKEVARKVLEIRKKGAFAGYTYRRPRSVFREEQGGMSVPRNDVMTSGS